MDTALTTGTMQAVVQHRYGTAAEDVLGLEEVARPAVHHDEVLVRVRAAGVDRGTWHLMAGIPYVMRLGFGFRGPKTPVPGLDLAGTVEAVGPGVTSLAPGDEVFGTAKGTFAEYAVVQEDWLYPTPANVSDEAAAAVALVGITAHLGLFRAARLQAGETVFVNGGTGGVGSMVVQMVKAVGA